MTRSDLAYHLHNNSKKIIEKWYPAMSIIRINKLKSNNKSLKNGHSLVDILSLYCEWWDFTKSNFDGLGESIDEILNRFNLLESTSITEINTIEKIFGYDFTYCYDIQNWRNSQIDKLWQN